MLFLNEFWNGNISPGEGRYHPSEEYSKAWRVMEKCEEQLKARLSEEDWDWFLKYQDAEREASYFTDTDIFIEGFRMGAKVIMDVLLKTA